MVEKLKKGMKIWGTCLWLLAGVFLCGKIEVYGAEGRLTEEEVKRQVVEIVEEDREGEGPSTIVQYDIEEIYPMRYMDLIINEYIDGISLEELLQKEEVRQTVDWVLPFENKKREKCKAIFRENNGVLELDSRVLDVGKSINLKEYTNKYKKNIKAIFYIELMLYDFDIVYITLNEGEEYIIPIVQNDTNEKRGLIHGNSYKIDDFFVYMYNYYDEPTEKELKEIGKKGRYGDIESLIIRKNTLSYDNIEEIRFVEKLKVIFSIMLISIFGILMVGKFVRKEKRNGRKI